MGDDHDDSDDDTPEDHEVPPSFSRLDRGGTRRYRVLTRASSHSRSRARSSRQRKQLPLAVLIGISIRHHGLTDEVRRRAVCLYWPEIAGERIASRTFPVSFSDGVLHLSAISSSWVQELRFLKAQLIAQIDAWLDANRMWLGPPALVTDIRCALGVPQRDWVVDPEHARRLRLRHLLRSRPREAVVPPIVSNAEREAIRTETSSVADAELRAVIETVRMKWNR